VDEKTTHIMSQWEEWVCASGRMNHHITQEFLACVLNTMW